MKSIAVIQHAANDGPGFFGTWLQRAHIPFKVFRMFDGSALPESIADHSGLCMLGGPMSANDPLPYFAPLLDLVRDWLETGAAEIRDARSPGVQQPADILPTLNVDLARSQTIASHIYGRWAQGLRG